MALSEERYLQRIGFSGKAKPDLKTLNALQRCHLTSVPYENLDLYYHRECSLAAEALYDKIVEKRRGGYCFELNGLFAWLLRRIGFQVREYFGRWLLGETLAIPMRRHRILHVQLGNSSYIADAGIGGVCPQTPLLFQEDLIQEREGWFYRIVQNDDLGWIVQRREGADGEFVNFYSFDLAPQQTIDFEYPHYYCSHHPDSVFCQKVMMHLPGKECRATVMASVDPETGQKCHVCLLHWNQDGHEEMIRLRSDEEILRIARTYFNIDFIL